MDTVTAQPVPGPHWGLRMLGAIGCIGYAALALTSGIERSAIMGLQHSVLMDWPYAIAVEYDAATAAIQRHDAQSAVTHARKLVRRAPVDARALSTYGLTLLEARQPERARDAFALAAQLGWRDPVTQRYWFNESMRLGDAERASHNLDALLRQTPDLPDRNKLLRLILPYDEGRTAVANRLKADPGWAVVFVAQMDGLDDADLDARADVVQRTGPGHWECAQAANLIDSLLTHGLPDDAAAVHRTVCKDNGANINDGDFNQLAAGTGESALDWSVARRGDLLASVNPETPQTHVLTMSTTATSTVMALGQMTTVGPGVYRVTWRMPDTSARDAAALQISFDCQFNLGNAVSGTRLNAGPALYEARFIVDDSCQTPALRAWLSPNHSVNLTSMRITRIGGRAPANPSR
jgi:tetratricopeptide (TPR) repeat protein